MKLLEDKIRKDGKIAEGNVLRVDSFLNHQIDTVLMDQLAAEFYRLFRDEKVDKVLTVEASGIAIAALTALHFGVPMVFAKKSKSQNISDNVYTAQAYSYTHQNMNTLIVSKDYIGPGERILLIDDFLANGHAMLALNSLLKQAGAIPVGVGILVEKAFQEGHARLEEAGLRVESLARVASMDTENGVTFL